MGFLDFLDTGPDDASEESRDAIARAYVRAARGAPADIERAARGVSSWLRLVERLRPVVPRHGATQSECAWMRISVCVACPVRAFRIWRVVSLTVAKETGSEQVLFGEGAHESAWGACGVVTLSLALTTGRAEPRAGTFAAALASALCDMKLMRVVAERLALPPSVASTGPSRALGILVERDIGRK